MDKDPRLVHAAQAPKDRRRRQTVSRGSAPTGWRPAWTKRQHTAAQSRARVSAEQLRDQRQGPACATSLRSHVSRRRRLKMTVASWHRGESWNQGRRRAGLRQEFLPERLPWVPHRPRLGFGPPPPPAVPAGVCPLSGPLHSQLSAFWDALSVAGGTSSRSPAAPTRAGLGTAGN